MSTMIVVSESNGRQLPDGGLKYAGVGHEPRQFRQKPKRAGRPALRADDRPGWQASPLGNHRYWTRERIVGGLRDFIERHPGPLPRKDSDYSALKKGHPEWPTATRVLEEFGAMARGFVAAGADPSRVSMHNVDWTQEEDDLLFSLAGVVPLATIARRLNRSYGSVRARMNKTHGRRARDVQCYYSGQQIAVMFNASITRILKLVRSGELPAVKRLGRWQIDLRDAERMRERIKAPRQSHKDWPIDVGDYDRRYGYRRRRGADGKFERYQPGEGA